MNWMTKGVAGRSKISSGEPICSTRPWFMTTTRSATSSASSWSCVTKTLVRRISSWSRRSQRRSSWRTLGVEGAERLVEEEDARLDGEGAGEGHSLPLAARELRGPPVGEPVELDHAQEARHLLSDLGLARPGLPLPHPQAEGHVLEDAHVAEEGVVLEHEADAPVLRAAWRPGPRRGLGPGPAARGRR
jgi:hypothetical protein